MTTYSEFFFILGLKAIVFSILYVLVLIFIFLDLWSGIRKSKKRNDYISSYGLRKTIDKIARYFNVLFAVTVLDLVVMFALFELHKPDYIFPVCTFGAVIFIGITEIRSIFEKAEKKDKAKAAETARLIQMALKNKDAINAILEQIKQEEDK